MKLSLMSEASKAMFTVSMMMSLRVLKGFTWPTRGIFEGKEPVDLLLNVQGDEPLLKSDRISSLAAFHLGSTFDVATIVRPMKGTPEHWKSPNAVKAIFVKQSHKCLYFRGRLSLLKG